jgi:glycosyltransferase involved in cell wall biosynthesis
MILSGLKMILRGERYGLMNPFLYIKRAIDKANCTHRILYDVTVVQEWIKAGYNAGIGRLSVKLRRELNKTTPLIAVIREGDNELILSQVNMRTLEKTGNAVKPVSGDIFLMPELQLKGVQVPDTFPCTGSLRKKGVKCYAILYDVLPLTMPQYFQKDTVDAYSGYIKDMISQYDGIIGISKAATDDLISYYKTNIEMTVSHTVNLGVSHLGMDSLKKKALTNVPYEVERFFNNENDVFLMVGTLEPRKGHDLVFQVFEQLWEQKDVKLSLCIVGHTGWDMDKFRNRIIEHPESGKRLLFLEAAPDYFLQFAYTNASALIQASAGEGFGLPLIEAGCYGLPIICSDIPVFHEVAKEHALYFDRNDMESLKKHIKDFPIRRDSGNLPDSSKIPMLTWKQSAKNYHELITESETNWYAQINTDGTVTYT